MIQLAYTPRSTKEKASKMRKEGNGTLMPAVFYGKKQASTPVSIAHSDFLKVWKQAGESSVVTLVSGTTKIDTLIHEVMVNPLTETPIHADFYVFEKGKKLEVEVPLEFVGVSPAVKDLAGNLIKVLHEVKVLASPEHIPHSIVVDIATLVDFDSVILAKDLKLPTGVELAVDEDEVVASVAQPKAEETEEVTVAPDLSSIEVEKKGKKEEEGEVAATE